MKRRILQIVIAILFLIMIFSGYKTVSYYSDMKRDADNFKKLSETVQSVESELVISDSESPLASHSALHGENSDLFGWIRIAGTDIDYPVMHTPEEPEFYIDRSFDKSYSRSGVPFLSADCFEGCGNYIVYAHNMKNGSMFASLLEYESKSYWEKHKTIHFDTLTERGKYEVIAAFKTEPNTFAYHEYTDLTDEEIFNEYIEAVYANAIYKTDIEACFEDGLLTLSTCSYHKDNGRFVVVARRIS